jgi:hypothetical protein
MTSNRKTFEEVCARLRDAGTYEPQDPNGEDYRFWVLEYHEDAVSRQFSFIVVSRADMRQQKLYTEYTLAALNRDEPAPDAYDDVSWVLEQAYSEHGKRWEAEVAAEEQASAAEKSRREAEEVAEKRAARIKKLQERQRLREAREKASQAEGEAVVGSVPEVSAPAEVSGGGPEQVVEGKTTPIGAGEAPEEVRETPAVERPVARVGAGEGPAVVEETPDVEGSQVSERPGIEVSEEGQGGGRKEKLVAVVEVPSRSGSGERERLKGTVEEKGKRGTREGGTPKEKDEVEEELVVSTPRSRL